MGDMKWLTILTLGALFSILAQAQVLGVKTVYLLPMAGGLDQYLALQLTSRGVLQVVTDPKKADAILTDAIGARLEESFNQLYGAPVDKDKSDKDKSDKDKSDASDSVRPNMRPLSSSRGLVFLVNRNTRDVLWSTFERPKKAEPDELKHVAAKIVERLAKDGKTQ
jgi:hypothetical protein